MARRKQSELGDIATRDRILNSAKKYFLEYGFQAAPLRKIAKDAGFTSGALYGYFDSKEALFYAITDPIAERLIKKLNEIKEEMDKIPDKARLRQMGSAYYHHIPEIVEILLSDRDAVKLIVTGSRGTRYEAFVEIAKRYEAVDKQIKALLGKDTYNLRTDKIPYNLKQAMYEVRGDYSRVQRQSINAIIQGSSADIMKIAMVKLFDYIKDKPDWNMLATIHDEVLIEIPASTTPEELMALAEVQRTAVSLDVPMKVDIEVSAIWGKGVSFNEWKEAGGFRNVFEKGE